MCVVNGGVRPACGVFKDHSNTAVEVTLGEAYEIKAFITLSSPSSGRHDAPCRGLSWRNTKEAGSTKKVSSCEQVLYGKSGWSSPTTDIWGVTGVCEFHWVTVKLGQERSVW